MKLLRETIRKMILEALKFDGTTRHGLMILKHPTKQVYLLVDGVHPMEDMFDLQDFYDNNLKAMLSLVSYTDDPCHDSMEVRKSAAVKGWGPTLYDLVMELTEQPLINDRGSVSDPAQSMMQFYKDKRTDVEKKLLDNIDDPDYPATETSEDDCQAGNMADYSYGKRVPDGVKWEDDPLSYAYNKSNTKRAQEMLEKGNQFIKSAHIEPEWILYLGSKLFKEKYV